MGAERAHGMAVATGVVLVSRSDTSIAVCAQYPYPRPPLPPGWTLTDTLMGGPPGPPWSGGIGTGGPPCEGLCAPPAPTSALRRAISSREDTSALVSRSFSVVRNSTLACSCVSHAFFRCRHLSAAVQHASR